MNETDDMPEHICTEDEFSRGLRPKLPIHCIHKSHGYCRVLYYQGDGYFMLLDPLDARVLAPRRLIKFVK